MKYEADKLIQKKIKEGRGTGYGIEYLPWFTINELGGYGCYRVRCKGNNDRIYHLASRLEVYTLLCLEKNPSITDIREQFPLDRSLTLAISEQVGVPHPGHRMKNNRTAQVMTVDFLCTVKNGESERYLAIAVSNEKDFTSGREYEKWEIMALACKAMGYEFYIVSDVELNQDIVHGMHWGYSKGGHGNSAETGVSLQDAQSEILGRLVVPKYRKMTIREFCNQLDIDYMNEEGRNLGIFRYLLAMRVLDYDYFKHPLSELVHVREISKGQYL